MKREKLTTKKKAAKKPPKIKRETPRVPDDQYAAWFRHASEESAQRDIETICERNGIRPHAYHIIEQNGRFAIVPSTRFAPGRHPTFARGAIVFDVFVANGKAKVIEPGPEQSVIRYLEEHPKGLQRPTEQAVPNRFLTTLAVERERLPIKRERL